ncbi:MAG: restriction endonuclease subunit S, partial [Candidatus Methanoperedens sp.]|nr:restriction endonuclease subunit S [Candidatus Methanoperedens sp.]
KTLMNELLTKGIGHEDFKGTEIGKIPQDWKVGELGDVADINKESREPAKEIPNNKFLYIDIESVEGGTGVIKMVKQILGKEAPSRARRVIHHNDVIMSTVRPYLKAFTIVPKDYNNQICSTGFAVLSCKKDILPHYLLYNLFSKKVIEQCNKMMIGSQYPALGQSQVAKIKIPLASLAEQKHIADILSKVDDIIQKAQENIKKTKALKMMMINQFLTGGLRTAFLDSLQGKRVIYETQVNE